MEHKSSHFHRWGNVAGPHGLEEQREDLLDILFPEKFQQSSEGVTD